MLHLSFPFCFPVPVGRGISLLVDHLTAWYKLTCSFVVLNLLGPVARKFRTCQGRVFYSGKCGRSLVRQSGWDGWHWGSVWKHPSRDQVSSRTQEKVRLSSITGITCIFLTQTAKPGFIMLFELSCWVSKIGVSGIEHPIKVAYIWQGVEIRMFPIGV